MAITPIETRYAGCRFRSRLEARWAVFYDGCGISWKYESQGYYVDTPAGRIKYLPDFLLDDCGQWAEVKGYLDEQGMERLFNLACGIARCGHGNDIVVFGDIPRQRSILWPVQLHFHQERLWGVPWDPYAVGCPLGRPRVAIAPSEEMAAHLTDGFPFGRPEWAEDGLDAARQARFEWGERG